MFIQYHTNKVDFKVCLKQLFFYDNFSSALSQVWHLNCRSRAALWLLFYVAFCTIMEISRQKEARSRDYALLLFRMTLRVLYSAQYHRQHCTLHAFEQFGALYMHNHDGKYPYRPGFEPGTQGYKPQSIRVSHQSRHHELQIFEISEVNEWMNTLTNERMRDS